jgi:hypothetical protein
MEALGTINSMVKKETIASMVMEQSKMILPKLIA